MNACKFNGLLWFVVWIIGEYLDTSDEDLASSKRIGQITINTKGKIEKINQFTSFLLTTITVAEFTEHNQNEQGEW